MVIYFAHINILFSLGDFDTFPITEIYIRDIRLEELKISIESYTRIFLFVKEKQTLELPTGIT